ncbi:hypothetical protein BU17DRAFT_72100 [Hysterangium stoloniferum]|nr:hypothetical protein BU17DRAFT_72100 [Hysterangium stoloniferum]
MNFSSLSIIDKYCDARRALFHAFGTRPLPRLLGNALFRHKTKSCLNQERLDYHCNREALNHVKFRDIHPSSRQGVDSLIGKVFEFEERLYIVHLADCRGGMTGVLRVVVCDYAVRSGSRGGVLMRIKSWPGEPRDEVGLAATSNFSLPPLDIVVVLRRLIKINTPMVIKESPMRPQTTPPAVAPAWLDFFLTVLAEAGAPVAEGAAVESGAPELWAASAAAGPKHWEHKSIRPETLV